LPFLLPGLQGLLPATGAVPRKSSGYFAFWVKKGKFASGTLQAQREGMKNVRKSTKIVAWVTSLTGLATLTLMSGTVRAPAPVVTVRVPAPTITVAVPNAYVWDGFEFVGVVGTQCFYLGAGDYWLPCDSVRLARFHKWERAHPDWHAHVIVNERYRLDAHGHVHPWHGDKHFDKDDHGRNRGH
jgi:hypothetical protein